MKMLHNIKDTPNNSYGICCLSTSSNNPLLAYPGSTVNGSVHIFDCANLRAVANIQAHRSPVVAMAIYDYDEENLSEESRKPSCFQNVPNIRALLATASNTGTVVRLWAIKTMNTVEQLAELRRGVRRHAFVTSMSFSNCGRWLALASETETLHVWRLDRLSMSADGEGVLPGDVSPETSHTSNKDNTTASTWTSWAMNTATKYATQYLPTSMGNALTAERAFITAQLPAAGLKSHVAVIPSNADHNLLNILACTREGYLLVYEVNVDQGGEANLVKQHCLLNTESKDDDME